MGGSFSTPSRLPIEVKVDSAGHPMVTEVAEVASKTTEAEPELEAATVSKTTITTEAPADVSKDQGKNETTQTQQKSMVSRLLKPITNVPISIGITKRGQKYGDKYGDINWISFYCTVLARFAYINDMYFIINYCNIFGPIIPLELLQAMNEHIKTIDSTDNTNLKDFLEDDKIFGRIDGYNNTNKFSLSVSTNPDLTQQITTHMYNDKKYIDFIPLAAQINAVNVIEYKSQNALDNIYEVPMNLTPDLFTQNEKQIIENAKKTYSTDTVPSYLKYISIATSNYGEIYVSCDTRVPNMINVLFRGTYSPKTLASYSKGTSIYNYTVGKNNAGGDETYLYGIFKLLSDVIHTLFNTIIYLAKTHLIPEIDKTDTNGKITLITTGHSLGGGLTTIFSYVWAEHIKHIYETINNKTEPVPVYTTMSRINSKIICISIGAPRVMGVKLADYFCEKHIMVDVYFKRLTVTGDPVPSQPATANFAHPCSTSTAKMVSSYTKKLWSYASNKSNERTKHEELLDKRKEISEDCNASYDTQLTKLSNTNVPRYARDLTCTNEKKSFITKNWNEFFRHLYYLDVSFRSAVFIARLIAKNTVSGFTIVALTYFTFEVPRTNDGETGCRLTYYEGEKTTKNKFFNLNKLRNIQNSFANTFTLDKLVNAQLTEDTLMNYDVFTAILNKEREKTERYHHSTLNLIQNSPAAKWTNNGAGAAALTGNVQSIGGDFIDINITNNGNKDNFFMTKKPNNNTVITLTNPDETNSIGNNIPVEKIEPKEAYYDETVLGELKNSTLEQPTTGGSRRFQKRSKKNKTNRRKGRRQNKSKRRNKINSKRHNKTRK